MSAVAQNLAAALRHRERKMNRRLAGGPIETVQSLGLGWDAFHGSLEDQEEAARALGLHTRVDLSGIGDRPMGLHLQRPDPMTAQTIAINEYLADTNERRKANAIGLKNALDARDQDARNELWSGYVNQVQASEQPSAPMDVQKFVAPGQSDAYRIRPAGTPEEQFLARLSPDKRAAYLKQKSEAEQASQKHTLEMAKLRSPEREPAVAVMGPDGKSMLVRQSEAYGMTPAQTRERTTEDERKSVGWHAQMQDAARTLNSLEDKLTDAEIYQMQTIPHEQLIGMANRGLLSENAKRYFRAFTQWSEARLRSVSGAAIGAHEYQSDRQTYGRQFGETPTLAEDRKRARSVVMQSTKDRAGVAMPRDAAPPPPSGLVRLMSPDGAETLDVPADQVEHYLKLGARKAGG